MILDFLMMAFFEDLKSTWKIILLSSISSILILLFLILFSYLFFFKNFKETIYVKHVYYRSPCLPIAHLIVCFINTFLIIETTYFIVSLFFMQLLIYFTFLLISYKIFRLLLIKNGNLKTGYEVTSDVLTVVSPSNDLKFENNESSSLTTDQVVVNENISYISVSSNLHLIS